MVVAEWIDNKDDRIWWLMDEEPFWVTFTRDDQVVAEMFFNFGKLDL